MFRTDDLLNFKLFRNAVIPSMTTTPAKLPPRSGQSNSLLSSPYSKGGGGGRPPPDYGPYQGPSSGRLGGGRIY